MDYCPNRDIPPLALKHLLRQTDWADDRTEEGIAGMLRASLLTMSVWQGDDLIGFCRAFGDGVYRAVIDDVVVDQAYRGRGIGLEMMRRLVDRLADVEEVSLGCEERMEGFYEKLGFERASWTLMTLPEE